MKYWFSETTISFIHKKRQQYLLMKRAPSSVAAARYRKISNIVRHLTTYIDMTLNIMCLTFIMITPRTLRNFGVIEINQRATEILFLLW